MQAHEQMEFLRAVAEFIGERIALIIAPLQQRILQLEEALSHGSDRADTADEREHLSVDDLHVFIRDHVQTALAQLPVPAVPVHVVGGFIDRDGDLYLSLSNGESKKMGCVIGRDGKDIDADAVRQTVKALFDAMEKPKDGKDGRDGVGFDDLRVYQRDDDERKVMLCFERGEVKKEFQLYFGYPLYQDIWCDGQYRRNDCVTLEGSVFMATQATTTKPGMPGCDWKLIVKRGREGERGKPGRDGKDGKDGQPGRDLTQLDFDGRKY